MMQWSGWKWLAPALAAAAQTGIDSLAGRALTWAALQHAAAAAAITLFAVLVRLPVADPGVTEPGGGKP